MLDVVVDIEELAAALMLSSRSFSTSSRTIAYLRGRLRVGLVILSGSGSSSSNDAISRFRCRPASSVGLIVLPCGDCSINDRSETSDEFCTCEATHSEQRVARVMGTWKDDVPSTSFWQFWVDGGLRAQRMSVCLPSRCVGHHCLETLKMAVRRFLLHTSLTFSEQTSVTRI